MEAQDASALPQSLTDAARAARGRHPLELLASAESVFLPDTRNYVSPQYFPELHILDSEWYFTSQSSALLGSMIAQDRPCLLGTPTVAVHLPMSDYLLVDRSRYILDRFPSIPASRLRNIDVREWVVEPGRGAVLLDPPWYFPEFGLWLDVALRAVDLGGVVLLPLIGEQTRPSAKGERDSLLAYLESTGRVEVLRDAVEYEIPVFEARALAVAGAKLSGPWRRADLAIVHVSKRPEAPSQLAAPRAGNRLVEPEWTTFLIGAQIVKLRSSSRTLPGHGLFEAVDGVRDFTLDSVSRRDPRIGQIDIWSSRNRVARVLNATLLVRALRIAEASTWPVTRLEDELLRNGLQGRHIHELLMYLEMTDGN